MVRDISRSGGRRFALQSAASRPNLIAPSSTGYQIPLVHLLRNAIDHGIEPAAEREAQGKDPEGSICYRLTTKETIL